MTTNSRKKVFKRLRVKIKRILCQGECNLHADCSYYGLFNTTYNKSLTENRVCRRQGCTDCDNPATCKKALGDLFKKCVHKTSAESQNPFAPEQNVCVMSTGTCSGTYSHYCPLDMSCNECLNQTHCDLIYGTTTTPGFWCMNGFCRNCEVGSATHNCAGNMQCDPDTLHCVN